MSLRIIGIDPGTHMSGWVIYDHTLLRVYDSGEMENEKLRDILRDPWNSPWDSYLHTEIHCSIETIESFMLRVGQDTFQTCIWVGVFKEAWEKWSGTKAHLVSRGDEKIILCGATTYKDPDTGKHRKVTDAMIAAACRARFPSTGGGMTPEVGIKSQPGPLYGVKGHARSALAVALTANAVYGLDGNPPITLKKGSKKELVTDLGIGF